MLQIFYKSINCYFFHGSFTVTLEKKKFYNIFQISATHFSISSKDSGIFLPLVSGRKSVRKPEVMAITVKIRVGMAGWMSARAATVVDRVPPSYRKVKDYLRISRLYLDIRAELSSFSILPRGFLNILKPISESPQTSPLLGES